MHGTHDHSARPEDPLIASKPVNSKFAGTIVAATASRILVNTARRFAYPFAPVLSRGLDVPLTAVSSLIAVNQITAVIGMVFGPLIDRWGYRIMMLAGLGILALGMLAAAMLPVYAVVLIALLAAGLGKTIFDPALQGYVGQRVAFRRRGLVIGVLEFSWAGSTLVGIPLIGFLINRYGWQSPFWLLGGAALLAVAALALLIPKEDPSEASIHPAAGSMWQAWQQLIRRRPALGAVAYGFFISMANDNLFVVYGVWLEDAFGMSILALGLGTGLIGLAEFFGEILTAAGGDRIGLKRSVFLGLTLSTICYGLLPVMGGTQTSALVGLFLLFFVFEFTMVSFLSLCTELMPTHRATMIAMFFAAAGLGRVFGALIGGPIWLAGGIYLIGTVSAGINALALVALGWGLYGWSPD